MDNPPIFSNGSSSSSAATERNDRNQEVVDCPQITATDLRYLKQKVSYPNVRVTAFLLAKTFARENGATAPNSVLTTNANLAALRSWDVGLPLDDLDQVTFSVASQGETSFLHLQGSDKEVWVSVITRWFTLCKPYCGKWDIAKTRITG
jgi:hypothetical protein